MFSRYGEHIFILTNRIIEKLSSLNYTQGVSCKLNMIPKSIDMQEKSYKLRGAIEMKTGILFNITVLIVLIMIKP